MQVLIVGGSLCGLTLALTCASCGISTRVVESAPKILRYGGCLRINRKRLFEAIGIADDDSRASVFPRPVGERLAVSWHALQNWLLQIAAEKSEIVIESGAAVVRVSSDACLATAVTSTGRLLTTPLIVGADGQCSTVRKAVDPERPAAIYAGYILWRGLTPEASLPGDTDFLRLGEDISLVTRDGHRLVAFPVANDAGSSRVSDRLISFTWYDPSRLGLLRELGCIDNQGSVLRLPRPNEIGPGLIDDLRDFADRQWPEPWRTVITHTIASGRMFAYTVAEYYPRRLYAGRIVLIGDAAHVASPVTERGFATGIEDAVALAAALAKAQVCHYDEALRSFERARLSAAQRLVATSRAWSRRYATDPVGASSQSLKGFIS